ncbi:MAG TPA: methyl-accepting chemotaxis protein [Planctomycetota bacterium]|nr:methyl-accepting chemotaxis protein [Planctomycetota bacterium]
MKLRTRLTLSIGLLALALGALSVLGATVLRSVVRDYGNLLGHEKALASNGMECYIALLQARRAEKDFLLRLDPSYLPKHQSAVDQVFINLDEIGQLGLDKTVLPKPAEAEKPSEHVPVSDVVEQVRSLTKAYVAGFTKLASAHQTRGYTQNDGLQKEFRAAAHALEGSFGDLNRDDLMVALLQIRRNEKDYQLRLRTDGEKYRTATIAKCDALVKMLDGLDPAKAEPIIKGVAAYRTAFNALADQDTTALAAEAELRKAAQALEPLFDWLHDGAEIIAKQRTTSVESFAERLSTIGTIAVVIGLIAGLLMALQLATSIAKPVVLVAGILDQVATGNFTANVSSERKDELGDMTRALGRTILSLRTAIGEVATQSRAVDERAAEVDTVSLQVASTAEENTAKASSAATGATEVSANVATVAAAAEEMTAAIGEISRNVSDVANIAKDADTKAEGARVEMNGLSKASDQITDALQIIRAIAEQTNLLALNATIEAARAGEAGRGFAVVVGEVKNLARQSAEATVSIDALLQAVQTKASSANSAITEVAKVVRHIAEVQTTVASAVEEQTATTQEIGRAVNEVNLGVAEISRAITGVNEAATVASAAATQANGVASSLKGAARTLAEVVGRFKV